MQGHNHQKILLGFDITNYDCFWTNPPLPSEVAEIDNHLREKGKAPGDKYLPKDLPTYDGLRKKFEHHHTVKYFGGSLFNFMSGIGMPGMDLRPMLYTYAGNLRTEREMRIASNTNGIILRPVPEIVGDLITDIPNNLVYQPRGAGDRIVIKDPTQGPAQAMLQFGVPNETLKGASAIVLHGSSLSRLGWEPFKLIRSRAPRHAQIIFVPPAQNSYKNEIERAEIGTFIKDDVSVLACTVPELGGPFGKAAINNLSQAWDSQGKLPNGVPRYGLITEGAKGAALVIQNGGVHPIRPFKVIASENNIGSGDMTAAGFVTALEAGMTPIKAAVVASAWGAAKAKQTARQATLIDPLSQIRDVAPQSPEVAEYISIIDRQGRRSGPRATLRANLR